MMFDEADARQRDADDSLGSFRERFHLLPDGQIYLDGNSLGLLSRDAEHAVDNALEQWKTLGIDGWMHADPEWFTLGERLGGMMAPLVGAEPDSVVVTGTTTVNLHALVSTFYRPEGTRRKILATALDFPSDVYALQSQIALRGGDPERDLVLVPSRDRRHIDEQDLMAAMAPDVALAVLPSVLYRSGQLLDIERLASAGRERGILVGFDCAHSVGAVPHHFDRWGVDFAFWCSYKYLNAGPGSVGAIYVNRALHGRMPGLAGWWGYLKERQFDMAHQWEGAPGAGAWQISTVPLLSASTLLGSLRIFAEAGIEQIRSKSLAQTTYLVDLLRSEGLTGYPYYFSVGTPRDEHRRGGHIALEHDSAAQIARALKHRGVIPDFRPPNVVRLAPIALYTTYQEIWTTVRHLKEIVDLREHLALPAGRSLVA